VAPSTLRALTFDCYGTLIDWDGGIRAAAGRVPALAGLDLERVVRDREEEEHALLADGFRLYGEILGESLVRAALRQGTRVPAAEARAFAASMGSWPPFPDSAEALGRLARRYRLAVLSNVETRVLEASAAALGDPFELRITAEELRSYKPAPAHFHAAIERLGLPAERVLHVAGSLYHDVRPARALGWSAVWIDRRGERDPGDAQPTAVYPSLAALADALGA